MNTIALTASILHEAACKVRSGEFGPDGQSKNADNDTLIEWIENQIWELQNAKHPQ